MVGNMTHWRRAIHRCWWLAAEFDEEDFFGYWAAAIRRGNEP
jgi:hypothetical protein